MENKFAEIIGPVAEYYWGKPNLALSRAGELRFGNRGSKSVDLVKGTWYDFETDLCGGVVDLIQYSDPNADTSKVLEQFGLPKNQLKQSTETVWTYEDDFATAKYQVIRRDGPDGKSYRQRQIASDGTFVWQMTGVTALPYRLPQLLKSNDTVFVVEGEKCADAVALLGLTCTTAHGGAGRWAETLTPYFKDRAVVILPDNDQAGHRHAHLVASSLFGTASVVKILHLPNLPLKGDAADWIAAGGTKAQLIDLANAASVYSPDQAPLTDNSVLTDSPLPSRFNLTPWAELPDIEAQWLIPNILPAGGLAALYGKPGTFKSFVALHIAAMIGSGNPVFGHDVVEGDVIYIAGEGGAGLKARRDAIIKAHGIKDPKVYFLRTQLDLRSSEADREALIAEITNRDLKPVLLIIDTLSRAFAGGNENASGDMGQFIAHVTTIQLRLNTAVLIIHHTGKDEARGLRGHSSLNGAVDAELEVQKLSELGDEDRSGQITVTKQKDGEDGLKFQYRLEIIQLGMIDASKTSLAVMPLDEDEAPQQRKKPLTGHRKTAFEALKQIIAEKGAIRELPKIPSDRRTVTVSEWRQHFYMSVPSDGTSNNDSKQKAFKRSSEALISDRTIGHWSDYVWIPDG
jgi:AAA domain